MTTLTSPVSKNGKEEKDNQQKDGSFLSGAMGLAVAAALGATLGLIFAPKSGEKLQKDIQKRAQDLADKFTKTKDEVQQIIKDIFGEVSEELEKNYVEIRGHILAEIDDMKDKAGLTEKKYNDMVDEAVKKYAKGKKWTEKSVGQLTKELQKDWKQLKETLQ